jgi:signal transduction histidine kinase
LAKNKKIQIEFCEDDHLRLQADSTRIKQALINVLGNDIKCNREQGSVRVSCEKVFEDWVRISIADKVFGIPEEKYADIFEPFEKSHIDKVNVGGVGIGLSISKDLVELMGGTIWFDSVNGEGSVFHIDFPVSNKMSFPDMSDKETRTLSSIKTDEREGKHKILYIKDVEANVALVRQIFSRRKDVKILFAINAEDGIKLAQVEF